ncbi:TIGR02117 family protein [Rhizobium sp. AAP43]|uniref:TIGR02117 family protein n=1 Tax=Rhizobium sp. AAP43 TaxID=1523420 RepID=UPI0006B8CB32|nr:TIGR02117 family protein [Rhizobium sp. AAP43]KPF46444.1 urease-associated protein [Rhizobium sp. AAP43]
MAGGVAGLMVLVCLGVLLPRPVFVPVDDTAPLSRKILILSNPIHTDIALPLDAEVRAAFADLAGDGLPLDAPDAAYLVIGWGGRSFYLETPQWADLKPLPVFRSLTVDWAVMHVDIAAAISLDHPQVRALEISEDGHRRLLAAIRESFTRKEGLPLVIEGAGYGAVDRFYEAEGAFNALIGCNTWTAAMLRVAGVTTGFWTPMPQLLDLSLDLHDQ